HCIHSLTRALLPLLPSTSAIYSLSLHDALPIFIYFLNLSGNRMVRTASFSLIRNKVSNCKRWLFSGIITSHLQLIIQLCFFRLRSEEHTSELQSRFDLVCRLLLE